jgi:hypothetical protein
LSRTISRNVWSWSKSMGNVKVYVRADTIRGVGI